MNLMANRLIEFQLKLGLVNFFLKLSNNKGFMALGFMSKKDIDTNFGQSMELLPCHRGSISKKSKK